MAPFARSLLPLLFLTGSVWATDLRHELNRLARDAAVRVVLDRSVSGPAPAIDKGGLPLDRLRAMAEAAGFRAVAAQPRGGKPIVVIVPSSEGPASLPKDRICASPTSEESQASEASQGHSLPAQTPLAAQVLIDSMVAHVAPAVVADLKTIGNQLPPLPGGRSEGSQFLDGLGPGVAALSFDRVEPRLQEMVPWGEVGLSQPGCFAIQGRQKATVLSGTPIQVPLEATVLHHAGPDTARNAVLKEALEVVPEVCPQGRIRLHLRLRRGVTLPMDVDNSMARGGRIGVCVEVCDGGEVVVTGLGIRTLTHQVEPPVDPLERFRRPRLMDDRRHDEDRHEVVPTELVVRFFVRRVM